MPCGVDDNVAQRYCLFTLPSRVVGQRRRRMELHCVSAGHVLERDGGDDANCVHSVPRGYALQWALQLRR